MPSQVETSENFEISKLWGEDSLIGEGLIGSRMGFVATSQQLQTEDGPEKEKQVGSKNGTGPILIGPEKETGSGNGYLIPVFGENSSLGSRDSGPCKALEIRKRIGSPVSGGKSCTTRKELGTEGRQERSENQSFVPTEMVRQANVRGVSMLVDLNDAECRRRRR